MRDVLTFVFYMLVLVSGGALEVMLPKALGVGVPILLGWTLFVASRRPAPVVVALALAAGAFEDALGALPFLTSVTFFVVVALIANRVHLTTWAFLLVYPLYEVWLWVVASLSSAELLAASLVAVPMAPVSMVFVGIYAWCERKAAIA